MEELIFVAEDAPEGGFTAHALGESIFTEAEDMNGLRKNVLDAVRCHWAEPAARPRIVRVHIS